MKLICNNKEFEIKRGETIGEALKEKILLYPDKTIITCKFNNEIKSLDYKPNTRWQCRTHRLYSHRRQKSVC